MSGQPPYNYYGADYRSQKPPASRHPYRASTGNAASLYNSYGAGPRYRDVPDDWSYYDDDYTDDSVSEDFQRMSIAGRAHPHAHAQQQQQQHPQARYNTYAANVAAGRSGHAQQYARSQRPPSPTDSSYSQTTTSASTVPYGTHAHAQQAAAFHAHRRMPSKSLDRFSHYLPKGYRLAGPYRGEEENVEPVYREEDRSRGVVMPARSVPRTRSVRRQSSPEARGREAFLRKAPQYYAQSDRRSTWNRSVSQDRLPKERERRASRGPQSQHMVRRPSSIGRYEAYSHADKTETAPPPAGALVRRSKSVGAKSFRRRRSMGNINVNPEFIRDPKNPNATSLRVDLGGREVDIAVNEREKKRRGPTIGSITINQNGVPKGEAGAGAGAPSESGKTRTTTQTEREWEERARRFLGDSSSSPPTSPDSDEFARMERKFNMRQRPRSASLGTTLTRRKVPLQIAPPPTPGTQVPPTPGSELRHTRISRKIVTRQALEELGYEYEDTGDTFTVFEILQPEQIDELMDFTARIRGIPPISRTYQTMQFKSQQKRKANKSFSNPLAARHDRRRARSRGERQYAEFRFGDEYRQRKAAPAPLKPVVNQEQRPYGYREREPLSAGPPMPGSWPAQPPPQPRNLPMPDHTRYQRPGPGNLGGPQTQQPATARGYAGEGRRYWR
ncbi:hypothetical protein ABW19_dt0210483 [Dactylella cylindrospora]|nr:hypothetical protein ABW19_dt0210483 [Dactylella cylindrospora]